MRPLVFCVEAGEKNGLGHLMRCLALAQAADNLGIQSVFFLQREGAQLAALRHDWVGKIIPLDSTVTSQGWADAAVVYANEHNACAIVVDGYHFDSSFSQTLNSFENTKVVLDDLLGELVNVADIIVNPAGQDQVATYQQRNSRAILCVGPEFRLLRREFTEHLPVAMNQRHSMVLNLGGSDPTGATIPLVEALSEALSEVPLRIVTGAGFTQLARLKEVIAQSAQPIQHIHDCQDMASVWSHSRLALVAAGGSQFELAVCQTPSILLMVANNQRNACNEVQTQGWAEVIDCTRGLPLNEIISMVKRHWYDDAQLHKMHDAAQHAAYSQGAMRLLDVIGETIDDQRK